MICPINTDIFDQVLGVSSQNITQLIEIVLPKFAQGFDLQKGAIFGFGPSSEMQPRMGVLKVSGLDNESLKKLDSNVDVHNMAQERNVGCINYGLSRSG